MRTIYGAIIIKIEYNTLMLCTTPPMDRIGDGMAFYTLGTSPFPEVVIHAKNYGKESLVM